MIALLACRNGHLHETFRLMQALWRAGTHPLGASNDGTGKAFIFLNRDPGGIGQGPLFNTFALA